MDVKIQISFVFNPITYPQFSLWNEFFVQSLHPVLAPKIKELFLDFCPPSGLVVVVHSHHRGLAPWSFLGNLRLGGGMDNCFGGWGVNMREEQIYIKNIQTRNTNCLGKGHTFTHLPPVGEVCKKYHFNNGAQTKGILLIAVEVKGIRWNESPCTTLSTPFLGTPPP